MQIIIFFFPGSLIWYTQRDHQQSVDIMSKWGFNELLQQTNKAYLTDQDQNEERKKEWDNKLLTPTT